MDTRTRRAIMRLVVICALAVGLPRFAEADLFLPYTVSGYGGLSSAVTGYSVAPFWWINGNGNVPGSALTPYGFDTYPFEAQSAYAYGFSTIGSGVASTIFDSVISGMTGSLLVSAPISINPGDILDLSFSVLSPAERNHYGVGFAVLLQGGTISAFLAAVTPMGTNNFDDMPHPTSRNLPVSSPGVTATVGAPSTAPMKLSTTEYNAQKISPGQCQPGTQLPSQTACETNIVTSYAPGAGTYQLLFAMYGGGTNFGPSALAVKSVDIQRVPEPASLLLLGSGLVTLAARRRFKQRQRQ